jgi:hypothetical protein
LRKRAQIVAMQAHFVVNRSVRRCRADQGDDAAQGMERTVTLCRRPSFDNVQDLSGVRKFFPAYEVMRQARSIRSVCQTQLLNQHFPWFVGDIPKLNRPSGRDIDRCASRIRSDRTPLGRAADGGFFLPLAFVRGTD